MSAKKSKEFQDLCKSYGVDYKNVPEILSVEDAFKVIGEDPMNLPDVSKVLKKHQQALINNYQAWIVAEALNEGWVPDFTNTEYKYTPWFYLSSGGGFSYDGYGAWRTDTFVGSRLCFKNKDLAIFAAKHFNTLYKGFYLME